MSMSKLPLRYSISRTLNDSISLIWGPKWPLTSKDKEIRDTFFTFGSLLYLMMHVKDILFA